MKFGLRSFGRYVPTEIVGDLLEKGEEARLGVQHRRMTIHFSDVAGFSRIAEQLTPAQLSEYLLVIQRGSRKPEQPARMASAAPGRRAHRSGVG